jgi:hypothetical protein
MASLAGHLDQGKDIVKYHSIKRGGTMVTFGIMLLVTLFFSALSISKAANLPLPSPNPIVRAGYGDEYYKRRWEKLCMGGGRYQAMAEAHELRKPNPCLQ